MPLRDYQKAASDFLVARRRALLLDDAGLGKSAEVLDACDRLALPRVLCVGPAVAGVSWPAELARWSPSRTFVNLDIAQMFGFDLPGFYFVSYDTLSRQGGDKLVDRLMWAPTWDALVLDEGQYLKSSGARRTIAVYGTATDTCGGIAENAARIWVLSGTLTPNHAGEAWTHFHALFPDDLARIPTFGRVPEEYEFQDHFCRVRNTVYGRVMEGSRNQAELRHAARDVYMRRRKKDVLPELPPLDWFVAPITVTDPEAEAAIQDAIAALPVRVDLNWTAKVRTEDVEILPPGPADPASVSTARRQLGELKVAGCVAWIEARLWAGEPKILVFAHHRSVLDDLYAKLFDYNPVLLHGGTSPADRALSVHAFQMDPVVRVFVGQIQAAGTAITLTAAKTVFFAEYASTPGVNYQAASRAHRVGQRDGVQVYFATVPGSLDEKIAATAARRAREVAQLFD